MNSNRPSMNASTPYIKRLNCGWENWCVSRTCRFDVYSKLAARLTFLSCHQLDQNSTLPCAISSVQILGASHTRRGFLERIVSPLLSENRDRPYRLSEALREITARANTLEKFGQPPMSRSSDERFC